jgi:hypothetical protein
LHFRPTPLFSGRFASHEAAHFLVAYLHGLPISGYFLTGRMLFPGAAGTELQVRPDTIAQLSAGELSAGELSRLATVLMAGVAAEAIAFGNAEGGADDEAKLEVLLRTMRPQWDDAMVGSAARWAVLQAVLLLQEYQEAHKALAAAMHAGRSLGDCISAIEANLPQAASAHHWPGKPSEVAGGGLDASTG